MWMTALLLGFAGSFHCVAMCSPLSLTATQGKKFLMNKVLYNAGRILTYGLMGAVAGSTGYFLVTPQTQNLLSLLFGATLLIMGFSGITSLRIPFLTSAMSGITAFLKLNFVRFLKRKTNLSLFLMGSVNGFLPCGLIFVALTACLILPGPINGFLFMIVFGMATLPALLGASSLLNLLVKSFRMSPRSLSSALLSVSGMLLILRVLVVCLQHAPTVQEGLVNIVLCR
jgi:sulfite exporter TauE/SafE